jgi:predicted DNA-binding transcriptional regulator YafY
MPTNKEALIRYRVIDRCLVNYDYVPKNKLIQACEEALDIAPIGERTIDQDIHDMREDDRLGYHAPIMFSRVKGGYYYDDPEYSINNIPLNEEEIDALSFAATMLDQFRNISIFSTFSGAVQKVVEAVNIKRMSKEEDLLPFIEFEQSPTDIGQQYIEPIIIAIKDKKVIKFKYQKFGVEKSYSHKVHPYLLKQYHNRWYLIGWNHDLEQIFTFSLDRFVGAPEIIDLPYHDIGFNTREYYKSVIGIIAPMQKPVKVVLKFTKSQVWYVITQPIHSSQKVTMKKDHAMVELKVIPTYELTQMIMGWGPEVEVMKPKGLREEILKLHQKCIEKIKGDA